MSLSVFTFASQLAVTTRSVICKWFWDGSSWPCYYWYHFCVYIRHALYFCC